MDHTASGLSFASSSLLPLESTDGQVLLQRSYGARTTSKSMVDAYARQEHQFSSGIASLVLVINAINVAYRIKYDQVEERSKINQLLSEGQRILATEKDVLGFSKVAKYLADNSLAKSKLTLGQLQTVALYLGFGSNAYYACTEENCNHESRMKLKQILGKRAEYYKWKSIDDFRAFAKDYVMRRLTGVIVNYDGRFSPLAGYDEVSDRFLVLGMSTDEGAVWVKSDDLFKGMTVVDPLSGVPHGCLHVHELVI